MLTNSLNNETIQSSIKDRLERIIMGCDNKASSEETQGHIEDLTNLLEGTGVDNPQKAAQTFYGQVRYLVCAHSVNRQTIVNLIDGKLENIKKFDEAMEIINEKMDNIDLFASFNFAPILSALQNHMNGQSEKWIDKIKKPQNEFEQTI